jgi:phosphomannomutase
MPPTIKFGTDGWRAVIADQFTFDNVRLVAQAIADYFLTAEVGGQRSEIRGQRSEVNAIVGYDRRFLSDTFARLVAEVLAANGIRTICTHAPTPTPAVSCAVKDRQLVGGVMITASHNPPEFNGIKIKAHYAGSADPGITRQIEAQLGKTPVRSENFETARQRGAIQVEDVTRRFIERVKNYTDFKLIADSGLDVAADCMHGAAGRIFEEMLAGTRCKVRTLHAEHNPLFGGVNPEPMPQNLADTARQLQARPSDICIVNDGDADRLAAMDDRGGYINTHYVFALLLRHFVRNRKGRGIVVKALTTTSLLDKMCAQWGIELKETPVGFKWIAEWMLKADVLIGGEESGGIGFQGHIPERDGILAGMLLLELLATERKKPSEIIADINREFGPHHYDRLDPHYPLEKIPGLMERLKTSPPQDLAGSPFERLTHYAGVKMYARDGSWLMVRGSGTEPIIRIYAESDTPQRVKRLIALGQEIAASL